MVGMVATSCSKGGIGNPFGSDDPLNGLPEYIRNAKPGDQKITPDPLIEADLPISSNQSYFLFQEGVAGEAQVFGRVLKPNYSVSLSIQNLNEFPGATFDPATGIFRWTPDQVFIPDGRAQIDLELKVRLLATSPEGAQVSRVKSFPLYLRPSSVQAVVVRDDLTEPFIREGRRTNFAVTVQYRGIVGQTALPNLRVLIDPPTSPRDEDLSKYVTQLGDPRQSSADPTHWIYRFEIDLYNVDLTKTSEDFKFRLSFQNPEAVSSTPREYSLQVRTDLQLPRSTLDRGTILAKAGERVVKEFVFYDPRDEGLLSIERENPSILPDGMTETCREGDTKSVQICSVVWDVPPQQSPRSVELRYRVESHSQAEDDTHSVYKIFRLTFQVVP